MLLSDRDIRKPRSSRGGSGSSPSTPRWSSRPAWTSAWTATSGSSRTTDTRTSTRPSEQAELTRLVEPDGTSRSSCTRGSSCSARTYEVVTLPDDVAARLEGKSSLGRLGLLTHSTAGFIDPGFSGHVTLELSNVATLPIKLWPGMKIGQLCFFRLSSPAEHRTARARRARATRGSAARRRRVPSRASTAPRSDDA